MPNECKPGGLLPQHKAMKIDDVKRMEFAQKHVRGEELTDELVKSANAIVAQMKLINADLEQKAPETEEDTDA